MSWELHQFSEWTMIGWTRNAIQNRISVDNSLGNSHLIKKSWKIQVTDGHNNNNWFVLIVNRGNPISLFLLLFSSCWRQWLCGI